MTTEIKTPANPAPRQHAADAGAAAPSLNALVAILGRLDEVGFPDAAETAAALEGADALPEDVRRQKFDGFLKFSGPTLADKAIEWLVVVLGEYVVVELVALTEGEPVRQVAGRLGIPAERERLRDFIFTFNGRANLYVGAQQRRASFDGTRRSNSADIAAYINFMLDFDRWRGETDAEAKDRFDDIIARLSPLGPKALVWSGNGLQAWFGIEPTSDVAAMAARAVKFGSLSKRMGSDNVSDLPRIMRLPFTFNIPTATKRARGRDVALAVPVKPPAANVRPMSTAVVEGDFLNAFSGILNKLRAGARKSIGRGGTADAGAEAGSDNPATKPRRAPLGPEQADRWLKAIPNGFDRNDWIGVLHAHNGAGGTRDAAVEWCATYEASDPAEDFRVLETLGVSSAGWGNLQTLLWTHAGVAAAKLTQSDARKVFGREPIAPEDENVAKSHDWLGSMNERFALIAGIKGVYDSKRNGTDPSPLRMRQIEEFRTFYNGLGRLGAVGLGTAWLARPDARRYEGVGLWTPGTAPPDHLNLWPGFTAKPKPGPWPVLDEFLRTILADGDMAKYEFLLNWIAHGLQNPLAKMETAVALIGEQGAGKGTLGKMLLDLWGPAFSVHIQTSEQLLGRFNAHLENTLFGFADEATFGKDRALSNRFKAMVTEPQFLIEPKFQTPRMAPNRAKWVLATNNTDGIPIEIGDRRVTVFELSEARARDTGYFGKLWAAWTSGEREAFLADMLTRDLTAFDPRSVLAGAAKREIGLATADAVTRWWKDILDEGELPRDVFDQSDQAGWEDVGAVIAQSNLYEDFEGWARRKRIHHIPTRAEIGRTLRRLCPGMQRKQGRHQGRPKERWGFPPLDQCRRTFNTALGGDDDPVN